MGLLDRLRATDVSPTDDARGGLDGLDEGQEQLVDRYRSLVRTAPTATIEQVHREAFSRLSETQRAEIYHELSRGAHTGERPLSSEPATLARAATRAEMRVPGSLERAVRGSQPDVAEGVMSSPLVSAFLPWRAVS